MDTISPALPPIGIVGAGSIAVAFALVFTRAGPAVRMFDPDAEGRERARRTFRDRAADLVAADLLDEVLDLLASRMTLHAAMAEASSDDVAMVIECPPERVEIKQAIFTELDRLAPRTAVLASASSALPVSLHAGELAGRARCLVAQPSRPTMPSAVSTQ